MRLTPLAASLYEELTELAVVDAHEHLPCESDYLSHCYSGPNLFAAGYIWHDLESAGLSSSFKSTLRYDGDRPVEEWWPQIKPFWQHVRHTSFARALQIAVRDLYGIGEISDQTVHILAERVKADNQPGLYKRVLQEHCRIRVTITSVDQVNFLEDPGLVGLSQSISSILRSPLQRVLRGEASSFRENESPKAGRLCTYSLEESVALIQDALREDLKQGAVGFKVTVADYAPPDYNLAKAEYWEALSTDLPLTRFPHLHSYLFHKCLDVVSRADVPVAVHTGYWGDFRQLDPKLMLGLALRRRDVRFDVFHLGMPMIRDALLIGKTCPNVTLNLTWCPVISQVQTRRALDEMLDLVPINKIIAFGGDYRVAVQKVYGHLVMARECVAAALADRIEASDFDRTEALRIARLWFAENPARIYGLPENAK